MTVDLDAIARRSGSDLSSLKLALPLIEQGFEPPFLARYRRDELGGVSEAALWMLQRQLRAERALESRREELTKQWQRTRLADASLAKAIVDAKTKTAINRVARRLKSEPIDPAVAIAPETLVATRLLNPQSGDSADIASIADAVGQTDQLARINESLDQALAKRVAESPQVLGAAIRWLTANASIRFIEVGDPNLESKRDDESSAAASHVDPNLSDRPQTEPGANWPSPDQLTSAGDAAESVADAAATETQPPTAAAAGGESAASAEAAAAETPVSEAPAAEATAAETPAATGDEAPAAEAPAATGDEAPGPEAAAVIETADTDTPATTDTPAAAETPADTDTPAAAEAPAATDHPAEKRPAEKNLAGSRGGKGGKQKGKGGDGAKPIVKKTKVLKKLSPRQRRRRWLIGILEPLVGKQIPIRNLSAFQTIVLSRALRGNLVRCQFVYDANQLIAQLQKTASHFNPAVAERLAAIISTHEAAIREATESQWWAELQEIATAELVDLSARHLDAQLHRGGLEAKTVMAIDAVGPRTSPIAIVAADGRLLHTEDIASQLDNQLRTASVTRLGELIHRFGVDLIVISNGPVRRATMIILGELISQSPADSVRWTIAERSGADAYSGSDLADREMRSTPRRFRAATWLAFSVLKPAWSLSKVNPLRLRLSSAQRELPDDLLAPALRDVMTSAISRGGLDVNSAAVDSLVQLPGMTRAVAQAIDRQRRQSLFTSRDQLLTLSEWPDEMSSRQAIGFLRVFGGEESLDATVIHPEDYSLARKLATALNIPLPPAAPSGYQPPSFDDQSDKSTGPGSDTVIEVPATGDAAKAADQAEPGESAFAVELQAAGDASAPAEAAEAKRDGAEGEITEAEANGDASQEKDEPAEATGEANEEKSEPVEANGDAGEEKSEPAEAKTEAAEPEVAEAAARHPLPDPALINKCIREWQVGSSRTHRLVHALCDPFGEESVLNASDPPSLMNRLPKTNELRPGDEVVGVVASVAPFGAFVEITPEATGLIRVSRLAEEFVEEIHDYIQVGDVVSAWVTDVDSRRKLQLSAISPQREEELRRQRQEQREQRGGRGGFGRDRQGKRGQTGRGGAAGGANEANRGAAPAGQAGGDQRGGGSRGNSRGNATGGGRGGQPAGRGDSRRGGRGDQSRRPGDGRGRDSRGRRDEPISYSTRVPKNEPAAPITEAMAEGKEPLRSFGDLMQFFKKDQPEPPAKKPPAKKPSGEKHPGGKGKQGVEPTPPAGDVQSETKPTRDAEISEKQASPERSTATKPAPVTDANTESERPTTSPSGQADSAAAGDSGSES